MKGLFKALLVHPIEPSPSGIPLVMVKFSLRVVFLTSGPFRTLGDLLPEGLFDNTYPLDILIIPIPWGWVL